MANKFPNGRSVLELTGADLKREGKNVKVNNAAFRGKNGIVMVYAPWCPHCINMVEPLLYLGDELKGYEFKIGAINSENNSNKEFVSALGVSGFPTLFGVNTKGILKELPTSNRSNDGLLKAICDMTKGDDEEDNSYCCEKDISGKYACKKTRKTKKN